MKLIRRTDYLNRLHNLKRTPDIKVITGIRRSGKSKLLEDFILDIKNEDKNANIIYIDFNNIEYDNIKEFKLLNEYILKLFVENKNNYLFIDEIQMCSNFERTINSLHNSEKFDIYITGSNAFLLSSDLATLFTGRTMNIEVFPFSFKEYLEYYENLDLNHYTLFDSYLKDGGLPGSYLYLNENDKKAYVVNVYKTIVNRDLLEKYKIKDIEILNNLAFYLMDNISNLTSPNKICDILISKKYETTHRTIGNYIDYLCNAFVFYKIKRYDIKGKKFLETSEKYYLVDHSFRSANLGSKIFDYGRIYENLVLLELLRRGYEVFIGKLYLKEIDFIATKFNEKIYIQVSLNISDEQTHYREITPLLSIKDAYPKMIITRTFRDEYQYEGVKIVDIANWLMDN